jgi:probable F420-dependent oxidoreductase
MASLGPVGIWAGDLDQYSMAEVRAVAALIDDLGYGTLWFPELLGREAFAQAGVLLAATRRVVVAAGAADVYARDPVAAAAGLRTLDEAFPGRFRLGLWESHPMLAEDVRGHRYGPPVETMRAYLDAMGAAPGSKPAGRPMLSALDPEMITLAAERSEGAIVLGMPVEHTRLARALLGPDRVLVVVQFVVLDPTRSLESARLARDQAGAALPNRRALLSDLGHTPKDVEMLTDRVVEALVVRGDQATIARRVAEQHAAGADHVALYVRTGTPATPPLAVWQALQPK